MPWRHFRRPSVADKAVNGGQWPLGPPHFRLTDRTDPVTPLMLRRLDQVSSGHRLRAEHASAATPMPAPDLEISLPARAENVAVIRHVLGGVGDALALHPEILSDVKLAVSEACANAVVHAYAEGEPGLLDLELRTGPEELEIVVRDHGRGMTPRADSPGLGVGLPLMASLAESLELTNRADGGTEVRLCFVTRDPDLPGGLS